MAPVSEFWKVVPGRPAHLDGIDPGATPGAPGDRAATEAATPELNAQLGSLSERLWAEGRRSVLVVLQGPDAAGKDGTIKHVFSGLNPLMTQATAFRQPSEEELRHDFLWRIHARTPAAGEIGIFNRSHYEDVVVARVHRLVAKEVWQGRFDLIKAFEQMLVHGGTTVVKVYLHISAAEQRRRLEERRDRPDKQWKLAASDWADRAKWDEFRAAYEEAITRTSTAHAPWYVVPADHKWYRNWAVSRILVDSLEAMDPHYPVPDEVPAEPSPPAVEG